MKTLDKLFPLFDDTPEPTLQELDKASLGIDDRPADVSYLEYTIDLLKTEIDKWKSENLYASQQLKETRMRLEKAERKIIKLDKLIKFFISDEVL